LHAVGTLSNAHLLRCSYRVGAQFFGQFDVVMTAR